MQKTLFIFRILFLLISLLGCVLLWHQVQDWELWLVLLIGIGIASLVIMVDLHIQCRVGDGRRALKNVK
jgi:cyanate permease